MDAAGSFFGSEALGVGSNTGFISAANVNEAMGPVDGNYFDVAECVKGFSTTDLAANAADGLCNSSNADHLWGANEDGWSIFIGLQDTYFGSGYSTNGLAVQAGVAGSIEAVLQGVITGASETVQAQYDTMPGHAVSTTSAHSLSDTKIRDAFTRLYSQYPGYGDMRGLVYVRRANDADAPASGQYGLNLTGYIDTVGTGLEWGVYYNNSPVTRQDLECLLLLMGMQLICLQW